MIRSAKHAAIPAPKNLTATVEWQVGRFDSNHFSVLLTGNCTFYFDLELLGFPCLRENKKADQNWLRFNIANELS